MTDVGRQKGTLLAARTPTEQPFPGTVRLMDRAVAALERPLPITGAVPGLVRALTGAGAAVLVSPPGTGKTTLVPLALADLLAEGDGPARRVVVAEPRRVAARAAAARMADLLGEKVGATVGHTVRGDRRVGPRTVVEVVTTGVLVQRLQRDAELPGVGAIVLDECHERHLDTDLALAFAVESRAALRPDLFLLATSATADAVRLAAVLDPGGAGAPVLGTDAAAFDVEPVWCPPAGPLDPPLGLRVDPRLLDHVAGVILRALTESPGDVLVFLPGVGEITAVAGRLRAGRATGAPAGVQVLQLHGRLSGAEQDAVLRPGRAGHRRVVLATAVAESSLTVPGVRAVVDAGLARVPRIDLSRGLGALATVRVSRAAAHQRAGRAGREASGRVYRCWSRSDHDRLPAQPEPEIAVCDLTGFALALARWGDPDGHDLALLDPPPAASMDVARQTLRALAALDDDGRVTARGRRLAEVGVHPRLARALLDGGPLVGTRRAAELVALLADESLGTGTDDLSRARSRLRSARAGDGGGGSDPGLAARWRDETRRLISAIGDASAETAAAGAVPDDLAAGLVAGLAFPERLAMARPGGGRSYLMAIGTAAEPAPGSALAGVAWLAVAVAQRQPGAPAARIRLAAAIDLTGAREVGAALLRTDREVVWSGGDVVARQVERLGAIELASRPLRDPDPQAVTAALRDGLRREGLGLLTWSPGALGLRARLAFCRLALGEEWPAMGDADLLASVWRWLGPELARSRRRADLARTDVVTALRRLADHRQLAMLDRVAPERITVPSGSAVRIQYSTDFDDPGQPVLAVKLQEVFGWTRSPAIGIPPGPAGTGRDGVPVLLHLLSPAGRPVAMTTDLASFWTGAYPQVRGEMRGRYPRHPWPDDPTAAAPTRRVTHAR